MARPPIDDARFRALGFRLPAPVYRSSDDCDGIRDAAVASGPGSHEPGCLPGDLVPRGLYHSFRLGFDVDERFNLYAGVDNAFDRLPPYNMVTGDQVTPTGSSPYDNIGRYFYIGTTAKF